MWMGGRWWIRFVLGLRSVCGFIKLDVPVRLIGNHMKGEGR